MNNLGKSKLNTLAEELRRNNSLGGSHMPKRVSTVTTVRCRHSLQRTLVQGALSVLYKVRAVKTKDVHIEVLVHVPYTLCLQWVVFTIHTFSIGDVI